MADEQKKGVTVVTATTPGREHHERATDIRVQDGHLFVTEGSALNASSQTVAVYAPSIWKSAKVVS